MPELSRFEEFKALLGFSKEISEPKISELSLKLATTETELTASRKSVSELTAKVSEQAARLIELEAKVATHASELEAKASAKALEIAAAQGIPAIKTPAVEDPAKVAPKIDPALKGLAKAYAAHALSTAGNPVYTRK